jgi:hypothetical protein
VALSLADRQYILESCGDHNVRVRNKGRKGHFVDPLLKLYYHVPLLLVSNDDVPNGHANGTRVLLEWVVLKKGVLPQQLSLWMALSALLLMLTLWIIFCVP